MSRFGKSFSELDSAANYQSRLIREDSPYPRTSYGDWIVVASVESIEFGWKGRADYERPENSRGIETLRSFLIS